MTAVLVVTAASEVFTRKTPRPSGRNAVKLTCDCGRSIRAYPDTIVKGAITCGACGGDFA